MRWRRWRPWRPLATTKTKLMTTRPEAANYIPWQPRQCRQPRRHFASRLQQLTTDHGQSATCRLRMPHDNVKSPRPPQPAAAHFQVAQRCGRWFSRPSANQARSEPKNSGAAPVACGMRNAEPYPAHSPMSAFSPVPKWYNVLRDTAAAQGAACPAVTRPSLAARRP